jgi:hypothetical protein
MDGERDREVAWMDCIFFVVKNGSPLALFLEANLYCSFMAHLKGIMALKLI